MRGTHEDELGSTYFRPNYRLGSIVTNESGRWGVVLNDSGHYAGSIVVTWLTDEGWADPVLRLRINGLSAPYVHTYEGIPDVVLAKATEVILTA